jgi:hypothetical protein
MVTEIEDMLKLLSREVQLLDEGFDALKPAGEVVDIGLWEVQKLRPPILCFRWNCRRELACRLEPDASLAQHSVFDRIALILAVPLDVAGCCLKADRGGFGKGKL